MSHGNIFEFMMEFHQGEEGGGEAADDVRAPSPAPQEKCNFAVLQNRLFVPRLLGAEGFSAPSGGISSRGLTAVFRVSL